MKCPDCNQLCLNLYFRDNRVDERSWVKTKLKYCKKCKKIVVKSDS
jgi:hypothetical protein